MVWSPIELAVNIFSILEKGVVPSLPCKNPSELLCYRYNNTSFLQNYLFPFSGSHILDKAEATNLLTQIISVCEGLTAETTTLLPSNVGNRLSNEYQIRIEPSVTERNFQHIKSVVKNTGLSVIDREDSDVTVIFGSLSTKYC